MSRVFLARYAWAASLLPCSLLACAALAARAEEPPSSPVATAEAITAEAASAPATGDEAGTPVPDDGALEAGGAVVGEIAIDTRNIFNPDEPGENHFLFRLANRIHRITRPQVITDQLLFKPGDPYSRRVLEESERLLRKNRYLYDAVIRPVGYHDGRVDLEVTTKDVWTLKVGAGVGRSGGANSNRFELQDSNFFGTGKSLTFERESNVDRTSAGLRYDDRNLFGSRVQLGVGYSSNSDGETRQLDLARPFFSLDSKWAAGLSFADDDRVDSLYELGHVSDQFQHRETRFELSGGLSAGLAKGWARRWRAGLTYRQDTFDSLVEPGATNLVPTDRTLAYPWVSFELVEDRFVKERNLDQIARTEDLELGGQLHARLGWSSPLFTADRNEAIFDLSAGKGWRTGEHQTLTFEVGSSGRIGNDGTHNLLTSVDARYYLRDFGEQLFFATLSYAAAEHLDPEQQVLLGGDNGLRGYPLRYQSGESRSLLTLEQRFFTPWHPFKLFHVGAAAFFDIGRTWDPDDTERGRVAGHLLSQGWLKDIGVGLRLSSSRSGLGNVIHIDLAFPLDGDGSIDRIQYLVTTQARF